jgi:exopolysaccharide biosynthesis predicted pyruvyltransferase EpsI
MEGVKNFFQTWLEKIPSIQFIKPLCNANMFL